jgi:hypothetical protein
MNTDDISENNDSLPAASQSPDIQEAEGFKEKKQTSSHLAQFLTQFEQETHAENKIRLSLDFMRTSLTQQQAPRFRDFWEARILCLPIFKENISAKNRSFLWNEYVELSLEARRLKEILDEQSAFAVEQIELAIQALERDLEHYQLLLAQIHPITLLEQSISIKEKKEAYNTLQRELQLLSVLASRINALRKEILKTEMRIRTKNKFFERLSSCGNRVFPKRKELIKSISDEFTQDIDHFVLSYFKEEGHSDVPFYALREEIKTLQAIAKTLTLNTHSFTETRLKLSSCWDQIKNEERERKKEFTRKTQAFKQNVDLVREKIQAFLLLCQTEITLDEANRQSNEILDFMKTVELGRDEVKMLRDEINRAKRPIYERIRTLEQERINKEKEVETKKREQINGIKDRLQALSSQTKEQDPEQLNLQYNELWTEFETLPISKVEKQIIERLFKQLKDLISEKKEQMLMSLSEDDLKSLSQLKAVLEERKERRQEIKDQLESYRKALGGSGFDFEKAMMYREMIEAEKASLDKVNSSIDEIEDKIAAIEG